MTHTHWDFFAPLFDRGNEWDIYAPRGLGQQLEVTLAGQMAYTYFPITLAQCAAIPKGGRSVARDGVVSARVAPGLPGVFAAGDVRHRSVKSATSAV